MDIKLLADNYLLSIFITDPIKRGTADILHRSDKTVIISERSSRAVMAYTENADEAFNFIGKLDSCPLICTNSRALTDNVMARFGLADDMTCRQAVWTGGKIKYEPNLEIVPADDEAMKIIRQHYKVISEEDLWQVKKNGNLFCGYAQGHLVGFVGQHLEGSMGILHVLPEFRRRGYAEELEAFLINRIVTEGRVPFAHILHDNIPSLALQGKLGLNLSEGFVYWAF